MSHRGEFGQTHLIEHSIETGSAAPIKSKVRPVNPKQDQEWKNHGVVEESSSPWNSHLLAVPKKSGVRWCLDLGRLNVLVAAAEKDDAFSLPVVESSLIKLAKSRVFSTMDGADAYHSILIKKEHQTKTAFSTPWEHLQFRAMPFRLSSAPATYCRLVQKVLEGLPLEHCLAYMDDAIAHTQTLEKHFDIVERLLKAYQDAGLKIQPSKCKMWRSEVAFLGHLVSEAGVGVVPDDVQVV